VLLMNYVPRAQGPEVFISSISAPLSPHMGGPTISSTRAATWGPDRDRTSSIVCIATSDRLNDSVS
jgi:hypothetical protein